MSTGVKLAIVAIVIIFVGGAAAFAAMFYAAHRVSTKVHELSGGLIGSNGNSGTKAGLNSGNQHGDGGDPCRYLSKEDVSAAIGVPIVGTQVEGEACSYLAKGNQGDMSAKHAALMLGAKGADANTQKMFQDFGSAIFKSMPQEKQDQGSDASGNVPVLSVSVSDSASATAEMKLNAKVLGNLGGNRAPSTKEDLNIGDQAFVTADSMIMIRKGNKVIRIMYMTCPCNTDAVKPLAQKLVSAI